MHGEGAARAVGLSAMAFPLSLSWFAICPFWTDRFLRIAATVVVPLRNSAETICDVTFRLNL